MFLKKKIRGPASSEFVQGSCLELGRAHPQFKICHLSVRLVSLLGFQLFAASCPLSHEVPQVYGLEPKALSLEPKASGPTF